MKAILLALTVLLPSLALANPVRDDDRVGLRQPRPTDTQEVTSPAQETPTAPATASPGNSYPTPPGPNERKKPSPQTPDLSGDGQSLLADYRRQLQGRRQVDPSEFFARLMRSEARNAPVWIEWMSRMMAQSGNGDHQQVRRRLWKDYADRYPDDPGAFSELGRADFTIGDYGSAVANYTISIGLGEVTPENLYGRGLAAERAGDYELAHQDSGLALSINPKDRTSESLYKLTDGRVSKVYVDLTTGLLKNPERRPGQDDKSDGAVSIAGGSKGSAPQAAATDPGRLSAALTTEAQRLLRLGDIRAAIEAARKAVALNPDNAQAFNLLATAYERSGLHDQAIADADNALKVQPRSVAALNTRAWAKSGLKRYAEALGDADQILLLDPTNSFGYLNRARALGGLDRREEMLDAVNRTAALDPRFGSLRDRALQLAPSDDTELLFAGVLDGQGQQAPILPKRSPKSRRLFFIMLATLSGGLLIALGLLHTLSPAWRRHVTSKLPWNTAEALEEPPLPAASGAAEEERTDGLPGFELKRVLATGGMGQVYEAVDEKLGRRVAIKKLRGEIRDDPKERERFLREAQTVAALRHPNIVQIHSVFEDGPDIYLVFEFVEGRPLEKMLSDRSGGLPWVRVLALLKGVCAALDHAHAHGVIHRDLKPSNIMVETDGSVKVMDFGVARQVKEALTRSTSTKTVWGTPCYMSPEAEEGKVSRAVDVYSLGVCVYEMATGEVPFEGAAGAMFAAKAAGRFVPATTLGRDLPQGLDEVLGRAMNPDPKRRQVSAMQVLTELRMLKD